MRFAFTQGQRSAWRGLLSLTMLGAFLVTIAAADAPRWHEQIHNAQGANHDCAVTILSAGGVEICGSGIIVSEPSQVPELYTFTATPAARLLSPLDFLLLEHAPPALS